MTDNIDTEVRYRIILPDDLRVLYERGKAEYMGQLSTLEIRTSRDGGGIAASLVDVVNMNTNSASTREVLSLIHFFSNKDMELKQILDKISLEKIQ